MNRCTVSLRRAKHAAYYKPPQYIHPAKESRIPIAIHPKYGNWENRDSMEHLEYMKQKVYLVLFKILQGGSNLAARAFIFVIQLNWLFFLFCS